MIILTRKEGRKTQEKTQERKEVMKQMYVCEKCGKMSEDFDEILKCEEMHFQIRRSWCDVEGLNEKLEEATEYKEGQAEPNVIHLVFTRSYYDDNSNEWKEEKRCGKYKLVSSYEAPLIITDE